MGQAQGRAGPTSGEKAGTNDANFKWQEGNFCPIPQSRAQEPWSFCSSASPQSPFFLFFRSNHGGQTRKIPGTRTACFEKREGRGLAGNLILRFFAVFVEGNGESHRAGLIEGCQSERDASCLEGDSGKRIIAGAEGGGEEHLKRNVLRRLVL